MKRMKFFALLAVILCFAVILSLPASASDTRYTSYTYNSEGESIAAPEAYSVKNLIDVSELGVTVEKLTDMDADANGNLYIVDSALNQIIKLDANNNLSAVVTTLSNGEALKEPHGISVGLDGNVYVADTGNARIIKLDAELNVIDIFGAPDKKEAQYDYDYKPLSVEADFDGRVYVIAENQTQGIFQFDKKGKFLGYYGAAKVIPSLSELFFRKFASQEQLKGMMRFIPTEYSNMALDGEGFMFCTVSTYSATEIQTAALTPDSSVTPIRRLNQSGSDILLRNGAFNPVGDMEFKYEYNDSMSGASTFVDITAYKYGVYSALDSRRGRIFTYNDQGELLYIVGSRGNDKGAFTAPTAILYRGDDMLVLDSSNATVTEFEPTKYALLTLRGIELYQKGEYEEEEKTWGEVLKIFPHSGVALKGIGKAYYNNGDYLKAMEYYEKAGNREYYSKALGKYINEAAGSAMKIILPCLAGILVIFIVIKILKKKGIIKQKKRESHFKENHPKLSKLIEQVRYSKYVSFHPFDGFWDLKHEGRGSVGSASCILVLAIIANIIRIRWTPFLFNNYDFTETSAVYEGIMNIASLVLLWCVSNWCFTTLMDGKGKMRDIYIYTCYALRPIIILYPAITLISYFLFIESATILSIIIYGTVVWVGFLIVAGTISTHSYSLSKAIVTIILTVVGMLIIAFLALLIFSIVQEAWQFVELLFKEISARL